MPVLDYVKRDLPSSLSDDEDGAVYLIGTDSPNFTRKLQRAANGHQPTETPTPESGDADADDYDRGGPVTRFTDAFSPLGMGLLEHLGLSGHEIADAVQMRVTELYRNEFPDPQPRFERKCTNDECEAELDERSEECPICGSDTREPDPAEKHRFEAMLKRVNKEGQSFRELAKACEFDQGFLGVPVIVLRYDYNRLGEPILPPKELVKGDPKRLVPVVDEHRRIGGYWWACFYCRSKEDYKPAREPGDCPECGSELKEVHFAEFGERRRTEEQAESYYFQHEVLTFPWYFPRLNGLDGLAPTHHVWLKQLIIEYMDSYAGAFYDPESDRLPNQFMILHTTNPDAWDTLLEQARQNAEEDQYDSPVYTMEYAPEVDERPEVQVVDAMPDELLGQNDILKDTFKKDIRQAFNIADVFDSDLAEAGGLNNEGLQLEVTDRSIATQMHDYTTGWLDELSKRLGIEDWTLGFIPSSGPDAEDLLREVQAGKLAEESGLDARMVGGQTEVADGEYDVPEPVPGEEFGGGGGLPMSESGGDGSSHDHGPAQRAQPEVDRLIDELSAYRSRFDAGPRGSMDEVEQRAQPEFARDEDVPANVENRIERAARQLRWGDTEGVRARPLREFFVKRLSQPQGFSIDSLANGLRDDLGMTGDPDYRVNVARTKSAQVLNVANDMAIEDLAARLEEEPLVYWDGPLDDDTTDACAELQRATDPNHGGTPLSMDEFDDLKADIKAEYFPEFRSHPGGPIHWMERHKKEVILPQQAGVDVPPEMTGAPTATAAGDD